MDVVAPLPKKVELLSPARDAAIGKLAISHGADAVYIGAPRFGARSAAGNALADIADLIRYAHLYRAKVYIAFNTLIYDSEWDDALRLIHELYDAGADALIIQDLGLLEADLPPIALHASTQTNNRSLERIQFLEKCGFERIILARELDLQSLHRMRQQSSVELEYFVHGSLCICYSGQCYLSQEAKERSANRGECAQMCRLPYDLCDAYGNVLQRQRHLLSLKDLNLSAHLESLLDAGITSFKIEGRLKDEGYVKNIVAYYRQTLDRLLEGRPQQSKASSGECSFHFMPRPEKSFNRGFSEYFLHERGPELLSPDTPKSIGEFLGHIRHLEKYSFTLDQEQLLHPGDGICFKDPQGIFTGVNINRIDGQKIFPNRMDGLSVGTTIHRNFDHLFHKNLQQDLSTRKISIAASVEENEQGLLLRGTDEDGLSHQCLLPGSFPPAEQAVRNRENVGKQLEKSGGTAFHLALAPESLTALNKHYPLSALNALRRQFLDEWEALRIAHYAPSPHPRHAAHPSFPFSQADYRENIANAHARKFYQQVGISHPQMAYEIDPPAHAELMRTKFCLKFELGLCPRQKPEQAVAEPLTLRQAKHSYSLSFDCHNCEMIIQK